MEIFTWPTVRAIWHSLEILPDISAYINSTGDKPIYAVTLGDMTWELYWYSRILVLQVHKYAERTDQRIADFSMYGKARQRLQSIFRLEASSKYAYQITDVLLVQYRKGSFCCS